MITSQKKKKKKLRKNYSKILFSYAQGGFKNPLIQEEEKLLFFDLLENLIQKEENEEISTQLISIFSIVMTEYYEGKQKDGFLENINRIMKWWSPNNESMSKDENENWKVNSIKILSALIPLVWSYEKRSRNNAYVKQFLAFIGNRLNSKGNSYEVFAEIFIFGLSLLIHNSTDEQLPEKVPKNLFGLLVLSLSILRGLPPSIKPLENILDGFLLNQQVLEKLANFYAIHYNQILKNLFSLANRDKTPSSLRSRAIRGIINLSTIVHDQAKEIPNFIDKMFPLAIKLLRKEIEEVELRKYPKFTEEQSYSLIDTKNEYCTILEDINEMSLIFGPKKFFNAVKTTLFELITSKKWEYIYIGLNSISYIGEYCSDIILTTKFEKSSYIDTILALVRNKNQVIRYAAISCLSDMIGYSFELMISGHLNDIVQVILSGMKDQYAQVRDATLALLIEFMESGSEFDLPSILESSWDKILIVVWESVKKNNSVKTGGKQLLALSTILCCLPVDSFNNFYKDALPYFIEELKNGKSKNEDELYFARIMECICSICDLIPDKKYIEKFSPAICSALLDAFKGLTEDGIFSLQFRIICNSCIRVMQFSHESFKSNVKYIMNFLKQNLLVKENRLTIDRYDGCDHDHDHDTHEKEYNSVFIQTVSSLLSLLHELVTEEYNIYEHVDYIFYIIDACLMDQSLHFRDLGLSVFPEYVKQLLKRNQLKDNHLDILFDLLDTVFTNDHNIVESISEMVKLQHNYLGEPHIEKLASFCAENILCGRSKEDLEKMEDVVDNSDYFLSISDLVCLTIKYQRNLFNRVFQKRIWPILKGKMRDGVQGDYYPSLNIISHIIEFDENFTKTLLLNDLEIINDLAVCCVDERPSVRQLAIYSVGEIFKYKSNYNIDFIKQLKKVIEKKDSREKLNIEATSNAVSALYKAAEVESDQELLQLWFSYLPILGEEEESHVIYSNLIKTLQRKESRKIILGNKYKKTDHLFKIISKIYNTNHVTLDISKNIINAVKGIKRTAPKLFQRSVEKLDKEGEKLILSLLKN